VPRIGRGGRGGDRHASGEDLSVESVAEILGCSEGTVKSQAARGLAKLREVLTRDGDR